MFFNEEMTNDLTKIANGFNNYFSNVAENIRSLEFTDYLKNPSEKIFHFESADSQEILLLIDSIETNKATGPNRIPNDILKLINLSFATGIYPTNLKVAKVIPTFKNKGDLLLVSSYTPISLLPNINKIFEKIVYKRIYSFLYRQNCLYELKYGFRAKHSTNHALFGLTKKRKENHLIVENFACGVFEHYGIKGVANNWFGSYLTGRTQYTSVNGFDSEYRDMKYGVPQGSVLGPLLFLIYIYDLHNAIKFRTVHQFADDTNLLISNESIKTVQTQINLDLTYLVKWLNANKISLNASKTKVLIFRHQNKPIMHRYIFSLHYLQTSTQ